MKNTDSITDMKDKFELIRHIKEIGVIMKSKKIVIENTSFNFSSFTEDCNKKEG